ncbi:MAG TPA: hypothetical protein VNO18_14640 [Xanthobacteraceae bacterium]|jgi:hypothetical protein|nr:hypothetical protein [Xanthobacteraceae bacterium]
MLCLSGVHRLQITENKKDNQTMLMSSGRRLGTSLFVVAVISAAVVPVTLTQVTPAFAQKRISPEKNPPGDIPDDQVFIEYRSPLGFSIKVPEGWARREAAGGVTFNDKYNTVEVTVEARAEPVTVNSVKNEQLAELRKNDKVAIQATGVKSEKLPAGTAIVVAYSSNSDLNAVTNKAIRLEDARYYFWKDGKLATLILASPYGADNADQWQLMAKSFRWQ